MKLVVARTTNAKWNMRKEVDGNNNIPSIIPHIVYTDLTPTLDENLCKYEKLNHKSMDEFEQNCNTC